MCGRFGASFTAPQVTKKFDLSNKPKLHQSYNIAPSQLILAVTKKSPNKGILMKWQFVPNWTTPPKIKYKPINARDDKLEGGFYRHAFQNNRCLVPASFFYEWKKFTLEGEEQKQPYLIKLKDEEMFGMAGICEIHTDAGGKDHYFCAIITTKPNSLMKPIHDRMPVIIHRDDYETWLAGKVSEAKKLVKPFPTDQMEAYRVSRDVNNPRNDSKDLIKRL
ncbi:SOS response-associated peptidase [Patescibacteria group bacterium]